MAVINLSTVSSFPKIEYIASVGTTQQELTLPVGKLTVTVGGDAAVYVATESVTDGAAMPADKATIPANQLLELQLGHSAQDRITKVAVAAVTGTANITVILERK
jgi:hypothetical protein